jgi:hypothetical protein
MNSADPGYKGGAVVVSAKPGYKAIEHLEFGQNRGLWRGAMDWHWMVRYAGSSSHFYRTG